MTELDKFISGDNVPVLEDLIEDDEGISVQNEPSNTNLSAYAATLSTGTNPIGTFSATQAELSVDGNSPTFNSLMEEVKQGLDFDRKNQFALMIADPNVPEAQKEQLVNAYTRGFEVPDTGVLVAQKSAAEDSKENATIEHEIVRLNTIDRIEGINNYNRRVQAIVNSEMAKSNPNLASKTVDFLEQLLPFGEGVQAGQVLKDLRTANGQEETNVAIGKGVALLGSTKAEIRDTLAKVPPQERLRLTEALISIVNGHDGIVLPDGNDFSRIEILRAGLEAGYYSETDKWIDNFVSVLDMSIVGTIFTRPAKALGKALRGGKKATEEFIPEELIDEGFSGLETTEDVVSTVNRRLNKSRVQPKSVSQIHAKTNVDKARSLHEATALDETDQVAKALYGTTRTEALANDLLPEMPELGGTVKYKVPNINQIDELTNTPNAKVMDFASSDGGIYFWKSEKRAMDTRVENDFRNAMGITSRDDMTQFTKTGGGVNIRAFYSQTDNGWADPEEAVKAVKYSLRDYGIADDQIEVLARYDGDWVPVTLKDLKAKETIRQTMLVKGQAPPSALNQPIEYAVAVNSQYKYNPVDVVEFKPADVRLNIFDRIPAWPFRGDRVGSFQRHILDAHSMLHPNLTFGASVSVDKAVGLERALSGLGQDYAKLFKQLPKQEQAVLNDLIKEMNVQSRNKTSLELKAAGVSDKGIEALKAWRESWDTIYWLENADLARTLRSRNYQLLVDDVTDTRVFARPLPRNQFSGNTKVWNQYTDEVQNLSPDDLSEIYKNGGTVAKLRNKIDAGDDYAEFIVVQNTQESYLRTIKDSDQVLNYREGYYQVHYKDPRFIVEEVTDSNGKFLYEKAVATAGNIKDADDMVRRLEATNGNKYFHRSDRGKQGRASSEDYWTVQTAAGRTAQKVRGKRLEDATSTVTAAGHDNVLDPITALSKSIRGLSSRVSMRNYLETTKQRFVSQYGGMLPRNEFNQPSFPNSIKDIKSKTGIASKDVADARTTFEYINYLENGYINSIDDAYKAIINTMADTVGAKGLSVAETVLRAGAEGKGPTAQVRNAAFKMYLAANPLRQWVVQSHQAVQLLANFPREVVTPQFPLQVALLGAHLRKIPVSDSILKAAGLSRKDANEMFTAFERSGLHAAVDANNLVRSDLIHLADTTVMQKAGTIASLPLNISQKVGFDLGEQLNIATSWVAHRMREVNNGTKFNDEVYDTIAAKARNYTYNMNAAGDMPYNQNALNVLFQFMQVPHKAMLQMLSNRGLSKVERARLVAFNTFMYGLPTGLMASWIGGIYPDNQTAKDAINYGFETVFYNAMLTELTGERTRIDFSDLAPNDIHGMYDHLATMITEGTLTNIFAESPSGSLFFGRNPRVTNAFKTAARYTGLIDDYEEPTEFSDVAKTSSQLFSGLSNAYKAMYALEYGKKINSLGGTTDKSVNTTEAIAQFLGFKTLDEAYAFKVKNTLYADSKDFSNDVRDWYREMKQHLTRKGITNEERDFAVKATSEAWRVFSKVEDQKARNEVFKLIKKDIQAGDVRLIASIFKHMNWGTEGDLKKIIEEVPLEPNEEWKRQALRDTLNVVMSRRGEE